MGRHHRRLGILRLLCFASLGGRSALPNPAVAGLWTAIGTDSVAQAALTRGGCSGARFLGPVVGETATSLRPNIARPVGSL